MRIKQRPAGAFGLRKVHPFPEIQYEQNEANLQLPAGAHWQKCDYCGDLFSSTRAPASLREENLDRLGQPLILCSYDQTMAESEPDYLAMILQSRRGRKQ